MTKITQTYMAAVLGILAHFDALDAVFNIVDVSGSDKQIDYLSVMTNNGGPLDRLAHHVRCGHSYCTYELKFGEVVMGVITVFWDHLGAVIDVFSRVWS